MSIEGVLRALDCSGLTYSECLAALASAQATKAETTQWALSTARETYRSQMATLSHKDSGFHFVVKKISEERLKGFSIDTMASEMEKLAPDLWELFRVLLSADPRRSYKKAWARRQAEPSENTGCSREHERREFAEVELGDLDDDEWVNMDRDEDEPEDIQELKEEQFNALISIVTLSCITAQHNAESNH